MGLPSDALAHNTISAADSFLIARAADAVVALAWFVLHDLLQASISAAGHSLLPGCFGVCEMIVPSGLAILWYVSVNVTVSPCEV